MSLSRYEGLRCQNVTFCPFCLGGEPQLGLHLLFWPFGSLKAEPLFGLLCRLLCFPTEWGDKVSSSPFRSFVPGADKKASSRGILNENKNQLGHGLGKIWGAFMWRNPEIREKRAPSEDLSGKSPHYNQVCSGVFVTFELEWPELLMGLLFIKYFYSNYSLHPTGQCYWFQTSKNKMKA